MDDVGVASATCLFGLCTGQELGAVVDSTRLDSTSTDELDKMKGRVEESLTVGKFLGSITLPPHGLREKIPIKM